MEHPAGTWPPKCSSEGFNPLRLARWTPCPRSARPDRSGGGRGIHPATAPAHEGDSIRYGEGRGGGFKSLRIMVVRGIQSATATTREGDSSRYRARWRGGFNLLPMARDGTSRVWGFIQRRQGDSTCYGGHVGGGFKSLPNRQAHAMGRRRKVIHRWGSSRYGGGFAQLQRGIHGATKGPRGGFNLLPRGIQPATEGSRK